MPHKFIVGYKTYALTAPYTLIGVSFEKVQGGAMPINEAVPYTAGMTKEYLSANADNLQVMGEDGNYTIYFLSNGRYGKGGASYDSELDGKWVKTAGQKCDDTIKVGQAFWYKSQTASAATPHNVTIAGTVLTETTDPTEISAAYTLVGNPYPCEVPINGGVITTGATKEYLSGNADNLQVMGEDGNYTIYFLSNGRYGKGGASYSEDYDGKWLKSAGMPCDDKLPAGGAMWYLSRSGSGSVQIVNPIAK